MKRKILSKIPVPVLALSLFIALASADVWGITFSYSDAYLYINGNKITNGTDTAVAVDIEVAGGESLTCPDDSGPITPFFDTGATVNYYATDGTTLYTTENPANASTTYTVLNISDIGAVIRMPRRLLGAGI